MTSPTPSARAVNATAGINAFMMTVHTSGGEIMMRAAADASTQVAENTGKERPMVLGVTILTSLNDNDIASIGYKHTINDQVCRMAEMAQECDLDGVVCSPHEVEMLRNICDPEFKLVVPGIRPTGFKADDQRRTMTPKEALQKGADYLVVGRPITQADDPVAAAREIVKELQE